MTTRRLELLGFNSGIGTSLVTVVTVPAGEKWTLRELIIHNGWTLAHRFEVLIPTSTYIWRGDVPGTTTIRVQLNTVLEVGDELQGRSVSNTTGLRVTGIVLKPV